MHPDRKTREPIVEFAIFRLKYDDLVYLWYRFLHLLLPTTKDATKCLWGTEVHAELVHGISCLIDEYLKTYKISSQAMQGQGYEYQETYISRIKPMVVYTNSLLDLFGPWLFN